MYLRCNRRFKDGKEHCYWNIVEAKRCAEGRVVQRQVLYPGINDSQQEAWCRVIEAFDEDTQERTQLTLFPAHREVPKHAKGYGVKVRLDAMQLHRPRQWGACWLACQLYEQLGLDQFWGARPPDSREGTRWRHILQTLVCYRLIDPGSEWHLHRLWFEHMRDGRSTGPQEENDKRHYGYRRDKRPNCVQVVIALIVTPDGFPLAYEVLPGNTADKTTLRELLWRKIETQYGRAERIWVTDRGIPTKEVLDEIRAADPPVYYPKNLS